MGDCPIMTKIVRTDCELECPILDAALCEMGADLVLLPDGIGEDDLTAAMRDADLLLMCYTPVTARVIAGAQVLKGIVKYGVGIDAIDMEAGKARHIPVVNIPQYAERTVAEGAFCLMIALARKLIPIERAMQSKGWIWPTEMWRGSDICGKTVGLVGAGRIGLAMARLAGAGFGAHVIGYDPNVPGDIMRAAGIEPFADLGALMAESDFVSVHCVLNAQTRHLVGPAEIAAMKPSAFLINVSRGAIVDETALLDALQERRIAGAGLDVYGREPLSRTGHPLSRLYDMDNVIVLPHLTFFTDEAMERLERETLARCLEILEGRDVLVKSRDPRLRGQTHGVFFSSD